ncbi:MAG: glutamate 5-kinase [Hyphomicrobiales bacterium]|nr:MAG: glutamate 5-kinase [Hyphomicrobiales bacterium]
MPAQARTAAVRPQWANARRIVVKIGSSLLVDRAQGRPKSAWLEALADDVSDLVAKGKEVIIVSSGAIALGRHLLNFPKGELPLEQSQAAAAVGQISLSSVYQSVFKARNLNAAQILLTLGDTEQRRRYLNARQTIETLLGLKVVPVVNENDTVATTEIRYGDNDRLSARVASMVSADCLVLLSDIEGLYTAPPNVSQDAALVEEVRQITAEIEGMAGSAGTELSKGGMVTKIEAGKIALASGCNMVITSGKVFNPLKALGEGARCTWFLAPSDPVTARKRWIAGQLEPKGVVAVDAGAERALLAGKSLLPAGITRVEGSFERGDSVVIRGPDGGEIGRGLIAYATAEAQLIIGKKSSEIASILGHAGRAAMIHRDDMVLARS